MVLCYCAIVVLCTWAVQPAGAIPPQQPDKLTGLLARAADTLEFRTVFEALVVVHERAGGEAPVLVAEEIVGG